MIIDINISVDVTLNPDNTSEQVCKELSRSLEGAVCRGLFNVPSVCMVTTWEQKIQGE
jgi:hypothetical protein